MVDRRRAPADYRAAQVRARRLARELGAEALRNIRQALAAHAIRLAAEVARISAEGGSFQRMRAIERANAVVEEIYDALGVELTRIIVEGRTLAFERVLEIWQDAALRAAASTGIPRRLLGLLEAPPVTLLGAFESVGGAAEWRTLLQGHVTRAAVNANQIIREAILAGTPPDELAHRLRPYVRGAETFYQAFGRLAPATFDLLVERVLEGAGNPRLREAARQLEFNARRIAWSERHNASHEAAVQAFASDPLVKAVGWRLSPDRGSLIPPDVCDLLAGQDLFGLGPGVYPVNAVPLPPHPFDRCELVPITRPIIEADRPKPLPSMIRDPLQVPVPGRVTSAKADRLRRQLFRVMQETLGSDAATRVLRFTNPET